MAIDAMGGEVEWATYAVVALALGLRHGFDADHLAAIDGLVRRSAAQPRLARFAGTWFTLGHGAVVVAFALALSTLANGWQVPGWLERFGGWFSIGFLLLIGMANLVGVLSAPAGSVVRPAGLRTAWLERRAGRFRGLAGRGGMAGVGALFALSFDTLGQAALFATVGAGVATAGQGGAWVAAGGLALLFVAGMLVTDGLNGLWIARLLRRSDETARIASRVMGLAVAGISLLVAGFGIARHLSPEVDQWSDDQGLAFGGAVVAIALLAYGAGRWLAREPRAWLTER